MKVNQVDHKKQSNYKLKTRNQINKAITIAAQMI